MFLKLPPIFVLSKPKLVAATTDVDSIAAQFSTTELMKTKLHLVAGESIANTDGENHHHGYDQLAKENITARRPSTPPSAARSEATPRSGKSRLRRRTSATEAATR